MTDQNRRITEAEWSAAILKGIIRYHKANRALPLPGPGHDPYLEALEFALSAVEAVIPPAHPV